MLNDFRVSNLLTTTDIPPFAPPAPFVVSKQGPTGDIPLSAQFMAKSLAQISIRFKLTIDGRSLLGTIGGSCESSYTMQGGLSV
jgi:hypothetical protein